MKHVVRAEWVKAFSDPAASWLLAALAATAAAADVLGVAAVYLGQAVAALAGVLAIGGEFSTGMIRVTLTAVPRRGRLLAAKAIVLAGPVLTATVLVGVPGWPLSLDTAAGLTLTALLGLGVATAVREPVAATGAALGLLYLFPVVAGLVTDPAGRRFAEEVSPLLRPGQGPAATAAWAAGALVLGWAVLHRSDL